MKQPTTGPVEASVDLAGKFFKGTTPVLAQVTCQDDVETACVRLHLPRTTPPGIYHGKIEIGNQSRSLEVEIYPRARLRFSPKTATVVARAGKRVTLFVDVTNGGNVDFLVPRVSGFGIFDSKGLDYAIGSALAAKSNSKKKRIDLFLEKASERHGGVVKLKATEGSGKLSPGQTKELKLVFEIPKQVVPGNLYTGTWELRNCKLPINLEIVPEK
jgi:hypothetical protein